MSEWKQKRFWDTAVAKQVEGGWGVSLDSRALKTPLKSALVVPTAQVAEAIAAEWNAQGENIDPSTMPFTKTSNSAIDKVTPQQAEVADMLAEYGGTDLLCYRADAPQGLVDRQAEGWDPMLAWASSRLDATLVSVTGVMFSAQDETALANLRAHVHALDAFELAAFHDLVGLSGSLVLGLAAAHAHGEADQIWGLSRIDETWQEDQWGRDDTAHAEAEIKREAFEHAYRFFQMVRKIRAWR
jgi:chaperone required for assembly of F1-ATPase